MEFRIGREVVYFDSDLVIFVEKLNEYEQYKEKNIKGTIKYICSDNIQRALEFVNEEYSLIVRKIIAELSEYGIYDYVVEDFLNSNLGYAKLLNSFTEYLKICGDISGQYNSQAKSAMENAAYRAQSQISGLDYGIITNNIFSSMLYDSFNSKKIKQETEKASQQFEIEAKSIINSTQIRINNDTKMYRDNEFVPKVKDAITEMFSYLFMFHIELLANCNKFNRKCIDGIDEKRAKSMLDNILVVSDKEQLILKVIKTCPYILEPYIVAEKYDCFDKGMAECLAVFGLKYRFIATVSSRLPEIENYESIKNAYKDVEKHISNIALVKGISFKEEFTSYIDVLYKEIEQHLSIMVKACYGGKEEIFKYLVERKISFTKDNAQHVVGEHILSIVTAEDLEYITRYSNKNLLNTISRICDNRISSYDELKEFIINQFCRYSSEFAERFFEIDNNKIEEEKRQKESEERDYVAKMAIAKAAREQKENEKIIIGIMVVIAIIVIVIAIAVKNANGL